MSKMILVVGGTGKTGSRVAARLQAEGRQVRIVSRSSDIRFDWQDEVTWPAALAGISSAYITYAPDIALPGAVERIQSFVQLSVKLGVSRLVLLTGRGEAEAEKAEAAVMASGAAWTIVRASWFAQNFSEGLFAEAIATGEVYFPCLDVLEPFIDVDDIADTVTRALLDAQHISQIYEVTGPELITFRQAFETISKHAGHPLKLVDVSVETYLAALKAAGVEEVYVELLKILTTEVLDGRNAHISDGVQRALGVPARPFIDFVRTSALAGVWSSGRQ